MNKQDLPLGFCFALAQNPDAMQYFSRLSDADQSEILKKAHAVSSKAEMHELVSGLSAQG